MDRRVFGGREATNRAGAASYLGRSLETVNRWASARQRPLVGWPSPVPESLTGTRGQWYYLSDLDDFRRTYLEPLAVKQRARVHQASLDGRDPGELIDADEYAEMIDTTRGGFDRYVSDSRPAWQRGEDGYLILPDEPKRNPHLPHARRKWKLGRVVDAINRRPGRGHGAGRPRNTA